MDAPLTREAVLDAAADVLRRYGPAKASVVDVARALGVSHGTVYRHFATKAELREAVVATWLGASSRPLETLARKDKPAPRRLKRWLDKLAAIKQSAALAEPDLFAAYAALAVEADGVVADHIERLCVQLEEIIADGVKRREFDVPDVRVAARAVFDGTSRFHHPAFAAEWSDPEIGLQLDAVWMLLLRGLTGGTDRPRPPVQLVRGPHAVHGPLAYRPG
jgi:AcrR family transcriptional regulator